MFEFINLTVKTNAIRVYAFLYQILLIK